jgi:YVTN family beta-propeller protein
LTIHLNQNFLRGLLLMAPALLLSGCRRSGFPDVPAGYREFAYVANRAGNTVTVLDLVYLRPDRTLAVGRAPVAVTPNPRRDEVYVVNSQCDGAAGSISVIDTAQNQVVATIPVQACPVFLSVDPRGHRAFVANSGSNTISVLDLDARRVLATLPAGQEPREALVSPDGRTLVVTSAVAGSVTLFSAGSTERPGAPLTFRNVYTGCPGATSAVVLPDSSKTYIACGAGHQVMAVGLSAAPDSWAAKQDASLTSDHPLAMLDVGQNPTNLTLKPDGGEVFASNSTSDTISEISTQTNEVGSTYPIGNRPTHGVISADNGFLYVSNSGADSLSLYSIDDGRLVSTLHTGTAPDALAFSADEHLLLAADSKSGDVAVIRTASKVGPALFTILPAGGSPTAIAVKAMQSKP